ncbi:MAG: 50S ribosomal protein L29 [Anaerolineaceae bacterium]|nr:50S ribosomal protein L29 [Anaerolineaceae bacterium]
MKTSEIRLMGIDEIKSKLLETRNEYMTLRFQVVSGQLTDTSKLKNSRRLISRYETILREKQIVADLEGAA